jgi:hypothetical protein
MNPSELQKRGFFIEHDHLVTPSGRFDLSAYSGAQVMDKTMPFLFKVLIFLVLLNISTLFVMGGATMPFGFGLLYLSSCWYAASRFEVVGVTAHGSHVLAEVKPPYYKFGSNEKEMANAIVNLVLEHKRRSGND